MIDQLMFRTNRIRSRAGTAYVEYFLAAVAFTLAAVWLFNGGAFQGLDAGHLVNRNGLAALFGHGGCRLIDLADVSAFPVEVGIRLWGQPVTAEMRLDGSFF